MNYKDILFLTILFLVAFFTWTLPLQESWLPFGEGDSAWHFANGDPQFNLDRSTTKMPYFIGLWYYNLSSLGPLYPEYPPPSHLNYALMQIAGGERILSPFLYMAITGFLGVLVTYFFIRKLYSPMIGFLAAFPLIYSMREIMLYLWGQRPSLLSFIFVPIILYALYKYLDGYYTKNQRVVYLYIFLLLVAAQFLLHIQGSVISFLCSLVYVITMSIKYKKIPIGKDNLKHVLISGLLLLIIIAPFAPIYYGLELGEASGERTVPLSRLLMWNVQKGTYQGSYPESYVELSGHYHWILLVLVALGVLLLLMRRKNKDLLILSWLGGIYLALHFDVFLGTTSPRLIRMMVTEPPVFFALISIGVMSLVSLLPTKTQVKKIAKIMVFVVLLVFIFQTKSPEALQTLEGAYSSLGRMTQQQYEFAEWLRLSDIPQDAFIYNRGTITYPKVRWQLSVSNRHIAQWYGKMRNDTYLTGKQYFIADYSDLRYLTQNAQYAQKLKDLQNFEIKNFENQVPLYNKDDIRLYEVIQPLEEIA
tara:strand:+ start:2982 stop:4580 length:1599 start_codon:yes stop_codon:yes gene_type:complete